VPIVEARILLTSFTYEAGLVFPQYGVSSP